jgi:hypothetical protein
LIQCGAWWKATSIQALQKTIEHVTHIGYPNIHHLSHISGSIQCMGSGDNFTSDISKRLYITNKNKTDQFTKNADYIQQILKHPDWCTSLDYLDETLSYLPFQGWYNIDSAKFSTHCLQPKNDKLLPQHNYYSSRIFGMCTYLPGITEGVAFDRTICPQSVQKYPISLTQRCIRTFLNSQLCSAIPWAK